jgi:hypothetical protein
MDGDGDRDERDYPPGRPTAYTRDYHAIAPNVFDDEDDRGLEPIDEARYADVPRHDDDEDDDYHLGRQWPLYLLADDRLSLLPLPPRLVSRLRRLSDSRLPTLVLRAVEEYVTRREAELPAPVPGSTPSTAPMWRPPAVPDPVPQEEIHDMVQRLLRGRS